MWLLRVRDVPVIAFAGFVIVAQNANAVADKGQAIFEAVPRSPDRGGHTPDDNFDEGLFVEDVPLVQQQFGRPRRPAYARN